MLGTRENSSPEASFPTGTGVTVPHTAVTYRTFEPSLIKTSACMHPRILSAGRLESLEFTCEIGRPHLPDCLESMRTCIYVSFSVATREDLTKRPLILDWLSDQLPCTPGLTLPGRNTPRLAFLPSRASCLAFGGTGGEASLTSAARRSAAKGLTCHPPSFVRFTEGHDYGLDVFRSISLHLFWLSRMQVA
jgi:hypothetical protein